MKTNRKYFQRHPRTSLAPGIQQPNMALFVLYFSISIALLTAWAFQKRFQPQQLTLCRSLQAEALSYLPTPQMTINNCIHEVTSDKITTTRSDFRFKCLPWTVRLSSFRDILLLRSLAVQQCFWPSDFFTAWITFWVETSLMVIFWLPFNLVVIALLEFAQLSGDWKLSNSSTNLNLLHVQD